MTANQSLDYHRRLPRGKIGTVVTKPLKTLNDLSLAYTPGVAEPCRQIAADPAAAYELTNKGHLVAVITNGTAVLGLGNIGPLAAKPVMEGKAALFKHFAGLDAVDIEIDETDKEKLVEIIASLAPGFGAINLEDIKAPECFYVEEQLIKRLPIPVFHDDQNGTAIVVAAGLTNALEIAGKKLASIKLVLNGAGAAGTATAKLLLTMGLKPRNLFVFDSRGLITTDRPNLNLYKQGLAQPGRPLSLTAAIKGADGFIGVSKADLLTPAMIRSMASRPIIFALANPDPEVRYDLAQKAAPGAIVATGRSDWPNQVNNVLCFPYIFQGALTAKVSRISLKMKLAAVKAIADLAKKPAAKAVEKIYGRRFSFGPEYILPKPFDRRLLKAVSAAVARAAKIP